MFSCTLRHYGGSIIPSKQCRLFLKF